MVVYQRRSTPRYLETFGFNVRMFCPVLHRPFRLQMLDVCFTYALEMLLAVDWGTPGHPRHSWVPLGRVWGMSGHPSGPRYHEEITAIRDSSLNILIRSLAVSGLICNMF